MPIFYRSPEPVQAVPKVLPQTRGDQPPRALLGGSQAVLAAVGVWMATAVPMPAQKPVAVIPVTLEQPVSQVPVTPQNIAVRSWDALQQQPPNPAGTAAWNVPALQAAQVPYTTVTVTWPTQDWKAQQPALVAAIIPPAVVQQFVPFTRAPLFWPPLDWRISSSPLIVVSVDQPAPTPYSRPIGNVLASWIPIAWPAQSGENTAGWNVPAAAPVAFTSYRRDSSPWPALDWPAQSEENGAGWNVPPSPPPAFIPYRRDGSNWPSLDWTTQSEPDSASWNYVPPIVSPFLPNAKVSPAIAVSWLPGEERKQSAAPNAGWNRPAVVVAFVPYTRVTGDLYSHWFRISWRVPPGAVWVPGTGAPETMALIGVLNTFPRLSGVTDAFTQITGEADAFVRLAGVADAFVALDGRTRAIVALTGIILLYPEEG